MENLIIQTSLVDHSNLYLLFQNQVTREIMYRKGALVFKQGMPAQYLYFIQSGKIKTYIENSQAQTLITSIFKNGDFFGYTSLFSASKYQESAEALEDSYLVKIPRAMFFSLLRNNSSILKLFINTLADDIHKKNAQLLSTAYDTDHKRVANMLINLANDNRSIENNLVQIAISKVDLANLLGMNGLTINRILIAFKSHGQIDMKGNGIIILDMQNFSNYCQNLE